MAGRPSGGRQHGVIAAIVVAASLVVAACAPGPFRYVANGKDGAFLKVPRGWTRIDQSRLDQAEAAALASSGRPLTAADKAIRKLVEWRVAFDADRRPSADHVVGFGVEPAIDVRVRRLGIDERDEVNLRTLRNLVLPYDDMKQQGADGFRVLRERELELGAGLRGVRLTFDFKGPDGRLYTLDQTALVDGRASRVYLLLIQAGDEQFYSQRRLLDEIAGSFTIRQKG